MAYFKPGLGSVRKIVEVPEGVNVGAIIGSKGANIKLIETDTRTKISFIQEKRFFVIAGECTTEAAERIRQRFLLTKDYKGGKNIERFVDIPVNIPLGIIIGKKFEIIQNLSQLTNCTIEVNVKKKKISISFKFEENGIEGMKEVKIFISKVAGITSPEMEKTAYFLTKLTDRQLVEMVPCSKFKPSICQTWGSNYYVLQPQELLFSKEDAMHFRYTDLLKDRLGEVLLTLLGGESSVGLKLE